LPLTQLTKKNQAFVWTPEVNKAFNQLKEALTSAPALAHVDEAKLFTMRQIHPTLLAEHPTKARGRWGVTSSRVSLMKI
jgi:hypothetical protein